MSSKLDKMAAYSYSGGGVVTEDIVFGVLYKIHCPADLLSPEKQVAQAHVDAVISRIKDLNCSVEQKINLLDSLCT